MFGSRWKHKSELLQAAIMLKESHVHHGSLDLVNIANHAGGCHDWENGQ